MTQDEIILDMLKKGWVTPLDALREAGCFRLGARIFDLTAKGCNIERGWYEYESQYGKKRVRKYKLNPSVKAEQRDEYWMGPERNGDGNK